MIRTIPIFTVQLSYIDFHLIMMRIFFILICFPLSIFAQKQNNNWLFGTWLGMSFNSGQMQIIPDKASDMYSPYWGSSISDKQTGQLLFYTNGQRIWGRDNVQMLGAYLYPNINPVTLIVPSASDSMQYYVFYSDNTSTIFYALVDMRLNGGMGDVVSKGNFLTTGADIQLTAVRQKYGKGHWLITHKRATNEFAFFAIDKKGVSTTPIISYAGASTTGYGSYTYGKLTTTNSGDRLLYTHSLFNAQMQSLGTVSEVFNINKECGTISYKVGLYPNITQANDISTCGTFDATGRFAYITLANSFSIYSLYQFDLDDSDPNASKQIITTATDYLGDIQLAPDGRIYIATSQNGSVTSLVDVIKNPSVNGMACNYNHHAIQLSSNPAPGSIYTEHFPNMILDLGSSVPLPDPYIKSLYTCLGDSTQLLLMDQFIYADSVKWKFGDGISYTEQGNAGLSIYHTYANTGKYPVTFSWFQCGVEYQEDDTVIIRPKPVSLLGSDTTLCAGISYVLHGGIADKYVWSTGDTTSIITIKEPGEYFVTLGGEGCILRDTVLFHYYPDIWTLLGDEYFICDKENELVKLDAGEGFQTYKWLPTGDTTQWINVAEIKDYFVIVKDFRGCEGNDGTKVKRRCPVQLFFPNAFTPNGDGINDYYLPIGTDVTDFKMSIYNRWGEKVFETDHINQGWSGIINGKPLSCDTYVVISEYEGYVNKHKKSFSYKGNVSLLR
jgi:gliding motility-associated-like protein